jgi:hypothetical protein
MLAHATQIQPGGKQSASGSIGTYPYAGADVSWLALLTFFSPPADSPTNLDDLLRKPNKSRRVRWQRQWGHDVIYLEVVTEDNGHIELWFDPQYNYLARKLIGYTHSAVDGEARGGDHEVVRFTEAAPGVFFPQQVESHYAFQRRAYATNTTTFTQIRVNESLPPNIFEFRFPAGLNLVVDRIESKVYKVNAAGELEERKNQSAVAVSPMALGNSLTPPGEVDQPNDTIEGKCQLSLPTEPFLSFRLAT